MHTFVEGRRGGTRDHRGFTLVELLVVVLILGVLAAVVVFSVGGITSRGRNASCVTEVREVRTAIEAFKAQSPTNANPANLAGTGDGQAPGDGAQRRRRRAARPATRTARRTERTPGRRARPDDARTLVSEARNHVHRLKRSSPIDGEHGSAIILALIVITVIGTITAASLSYLRTSLTATNNATAPVAHLGCGGRRCDADRDRVSPSPSRGRAQSRTHVPGVDDDVPRRRGNGHRRRLPASRIAGPDRTPRWRSS